MRWCGFRPPRSVWPSRSLHRALGDAPCPCRLPTGVRRQGRVRIVRARPLRASHTRESQHGSNRTRDSPCLSESSETRRRVAGRLPRPIARHAPPCSRCGDAARSAHSVATDVPPVGNNGPDRRQKDDRDQYQDRSSQRAHKDPPNVCQNWADGGAKTPSQAPTSTYSRLFALSASCVRAKPPRLTRVNQCRDFGLYS